MPRCFVHSHFLPFEDLGYVFVAQAGHSSRCGWGKMGVQVRRDGCGVGQGVLHSMRPCVLHSVHLIDVVIVVTSYYVLACAENMFQND